MSKVLRRVVPVVVLLSGAAVAWVLLRNGGEEDGSIRASGTVEATDADLGFQAAGRIASVDAREGASVRSGDELARLDLRELEARRMGGEAALMAARAGLREMERGFRREEIAEGRAALRAADSRLADARRDVERVALLFEGGAVSREAMDKARSALDVAESMEAQGRERLNILEGGPRSERVDVQRAAVAQAEAMLAQIDALRDHMTIVAPRGGVVSIRHREPGETVAPGVPVITLTDLDDRWVRIYVREDRIGDLSLGQAATIQADTHPDRTYGGEVVFIASEAEFTPRNVQTTEERVRLVYAVKVRITGDESYDLKPGIPADVTLDAPGS